jgi:hypothetical protein
MAYALALCACSLQLVLYPLLVYLSVHYNVQILASCYYEHDIGSTQLGVFYERFCPASGRVRVQHGCSALGLPALLCL